MPVNSLMASEKKQLRLIKRQMEDQKQISVYDPDKVPILEVLAVIRGLHDI